MYKSCGRVDRSQSGNGWKKGLVVFSCLCWELGSDSDGMAGGRSPHSLGSGAWKPGLGKRRWTGLHSHSRYLKSSCSYCQKLCLYLQPSTHTAASWGGDGMAQSQIPFPFSCSQQVAHVVLAQYSGQDLLSPCFSSTVLEVSP